MYKEKATATVVSFSSLCYLWNKRKKGSLSLYHTLPLTEYHNAMVIVIYDGEKKLAIVILHQREHEFSLTAFLVVTALVSVWWYIVTPYSLHRWFPPSTILGQELNYNIMLSRTHTNTLEWYFQTSLVRR